MSYVLVKEPVLFQTPEKLLSIANKVTATLVHHRSTNSQVILESDDGMLRLKLLFFRKNGFDNVSLNLYGVTSDENAKKMTDFTLAYLEGKHSFKEMQRFTFRFH